MTDPAHAALSESIATALLDLAVERSGRTFCPSEVARKLRPDEWRELMPTIRAVAERLVEEGRLHCWQHGAPVSPTLAVGPIRLSL